MYPIFFLNLLPNSMPYLPCKLAHFHELTVTPVGPPVLLCVGPLGWPVRPQASSSVGRSEPLVVGGGTKTHSPEDWGCPPG